MKHICFFNSVKFWGGGEKLHLENAIEFKKKHYQLTLVVHPNGPLSQKAKLHKLPTFPLKVANLSFLNPFKIMRLVRFYKKEKIDTVVFSSSQDSKIASIAAKIAGVQKIVYLRGLAVSIKASWINRIIFKHCITHIVSNSEETKRQILKHLGKYISHDKVHTIYHGIDVSKPEIPPSTLVKSIRAKGKGIILGNAGRLTAQKGQKKLIEVAKLLKKQGLEFTLFIAGSGELETELKTLIANYQLQEEVILLGFVEDMDGFMEAIDIFLLSSIWEGFGYVIVEAMLKSKVVVAFDKTSNPEIIKANETGFLVAYPDVEMFAAKTSTLIKDETLRQEMGQAALKRVYERFVIEDRITEFEEYLLGNAGK